MKSSLRAALLTSTVAVTMIMTQPDTALGQAVTPAVASATGIATANIHHLLHAQPTITERRLASIAAALAELERERNA